MHRNSVSASVVVRRSRSPATDGLRNSAQTHAISTRAEYRSLIRAREKTIRDVLQRIIPVLRLKTALDAGAGVGFFSETLRDCGLSVSGFDGREENVD